MYHVNVMSTVIVYIVRNHSSVHTYERSFEPRLPVLMISDIVMLVCNFKSQQQALMIDELTYGIKMLATLW